MKIVPHMSQCSFTGYDVRRGTSLLMTSLPIVAQEVSSHLKGTDSILYLWGGKSLGGRLESGLAKMEYKLWKENLSDVKTYNPEYTQDLFTITTDKRLYAEAFASPVCENLKDELGLVVSPVYSHQQGGNFWIVKEKDGKSQTMLVGSEIFYNIKEETLKTKYNVDKVIKLAQNDYHLDLFLRPLDNKRILVNDDSMMLNKLHSMLADLQKKAVGSSDKNLVTLVKNFEEMINKYKIFLCNLVPPSAYKTISSYPKIKETGQIIKILEQNGFNVIRVPGRINMPRYLSGAGLPADELTMLNYLNSLCVYKNNDLLYLTNKSDIIKYNYLYDLEKYTDFDFEKFFTDSLKGYIKPENIKFLEGSAPEMLPGQDKTLPYLLRYRDCGLHCVCTEIPRD